MAEGVVGSTMEEAKRHPWIIGGAVVGLVLLFWLAGRGGGGQASKPENFTFSYGPTDAQLKNSTDLAISENANQTAVSLANIQAGTQSSYFDYLTSAGNTNAATAVSLANISAASSNYQLSTNDSTAITLAQTNGYTQEALTGIQGDNATQLALIAAGSSNYQADVAASTAKNLADVQAETVQHGQDQALAIANVNGAWSAYPTSSNNTNKLDLTAAYTQGLIPNPWQAGTA